MSTFKNITAKATVQGALALSTFLTADYLAFSGKISGEAWLGVVLLIAGYYFGKATLNGTSKPE